MARNFESVSGISFATDAICVAQYIPEQRQIAKFSIQHIDEQAPDLWESAAPGLKQLVRAVKLAGENVVSSLPAEYAIIRKLCLDNDEPNLDDAMEWEFSQHIIGSRDEFVFDFEKMAFVPKAGLEQYLVVGYRNELVEKISRILRTNKLNPLIIDLDIFALINVYEANYSESVKSPTVLVLADESLSKCVLTVDGHYVDMESVNHKQQAQNPESYASVVENAIAKLDLCNPGMIQRESLPVLYSGTLFSQSEFAEEVKKGIRNADMLLPFRTIACGMGIADDDLKKYAPQVAVAVGLALRGSEQVA